MFQKIRLGSTSILEYSQDQHLSDNTASNNMYRMNYMPLDRTIQLGSICTLPATDACGELPQFRSMKVPVPMVHLMSPTSKQHSPNNAPVWSDTWTIRREPINITMSIVENNLWIFTLVNYMLLPIPYTYMQVHV